MAAELNEELQRELEKGHHPVEVIDPSTQKVYFLIAREHYERLKPLFEQDPLSEREQKELLRQAGRRAGWDDPEMDAYDHYDEHRPPEL
jgi:hypothetical protein